MRDLKIIYLLIPVLLLLFSCNSDTKKTSEVAKQHSSEQTIQSSSANNKYEIVENEKVCMVNDRFMGVKQIPIEAEGITYYGCCQNCVKKIQENQENVRYSKDPLSGEKVDKATAVIVKSNEDGSVKYFSSKQSAEEFMKK